VRPEGSEEMQRLHARRLERFVQVRIPIVPKLHDVQERLQNRLILIVATGRTDRSIEGLSEAPGVGQRHFGLRGLLERFPCRVKPRRGLSCYVHRSRQHGTPPHHAALTHRPTVAESAESLRKMERSSFE